MLETKNLSIYFEVKQRRFILRNEIISTEGCIRLG